MCSDLLLQIIVLCASRLQLLNGGFVPKVDASVPN